MDSTAAARPRGDITTLLDIATRDSQDDYYSPLTTDLSWFSADSDRRSRPFVPALQSFPFRGPAEFGQHFVFDVGSVSCGDLLNGLFLQIKLGHWFDETTVLRIQSGRYTYKDPSTAWYYANSLGTALLARAELEVGDQILETLGGDFSFVMGRLLTDLNGQIGPNVDGTGFATLSRLQTWPQHRVFPTEKGELLVALPFFFGRTAEEAFPLLACRDGTVRVHLYFRPFTECVRLASGQRGDCTETPLGKSFLFIDNGYISKPTITVTAAPTAPQFKEVQLLTVGTYCSGDIRDRLLHSPFEILHRIVQTWQFSEPLKYVVNKTAGDMITVQLPLDADDPLEEIVWFLRRRAATTLNNEWTNFTNVVSAEYDPVYRPVAPYLQTAEIQVDGISVIQADEQYFRQLAARHHRGGIASFASYIYGYPFALKPGVHQPSGSMNASRTQSIRLTLGVHSPGGNFSQEWEVVVFGIGLSWLRFENGIANRLFH